MIMLIGFIQNFLLHRKEKLKRARDICYHCEYYYCIYVHGGMDRLQCCAKQHNYGVIDCKDFKQRKLNCRRNM